MGNSRYKKTHSKELEESLEHLNRRATSTRFLQDEIVQLKQLPKATSGNSVNRDARARLQISIAHSLYAAGRATKAEFFYFLTIPMINVLEDRWLNGAYDDELGPISNQMREIEKKHGLTEEQSWRIGEGPLKHQALERQYGEILDQKQTDVFREFGEDLIAKRWISDRVKFDDLFKKGRIAIFEKEDYLQSLHKLAQQYEREATACAQINAYYAGCALFGAAMEAQLLLRCISNPSESHQAWKKLPPKKRTKSKNPTDWNLALLLEVCAIAGWLPQLDGEFVTHLPEAWGHQLRKLRNFLHPGSHVRKRPRTTFEKEEYEDARAIYTLIVSQLGNSEVTR